MRSRQRGITFIGWLFLLAPLALLVYAAIRATPVYLNYMKVASSVEQVADGQRGEGAVTPAVLRSSLQNRFDVEDVERPAVKDIDMYRDGERWVIEADYFDEAPLFGDIALRIHFHKRAVVQ